MDRRTDRRTEIYIQAAINSVPQFGFQRPAKALCDLGIPLTTTVRVLTQPGERRGARIGERRAASRDGRWAADDTPLVRVPEIEP